MSGILGSCCSAVITVLIVRPQVSPQLMRHDMEKRELEQTPLRDGGAAIVGMKGSHRTVAAATMVGMDLSAVGCIFGCCDDDGHGSFCGRLHLVFLR